MLDAAVEGADRLVLVSAPAGSGKSTLVATWSAGRRGAAAWLQAEASDSDPARFWSHVVAAVGRACPIAAGDLQQVVVGARGDDLAVVPALVNALEEVALPLVVVVDDYHLIDDETVHRGVARLVDLCPPEVTLVLATRADPPFRLGRLRVRGQLAEVRADDLRFRPDEAPGLLGPAGRALAPGLVDQLCARTEGWAAGLVLAGLAIARGGAPGRPSRAEGPGGPGGPGGAGGLPGDAAGAVAAFRGDDQLVVDYLRDEILAGLDPGDRRRLLETSVLDELSGDLVDAVTGGSGGARWLRGLARTNQLVVGLDRTGTWFRCHHLLRDVLRLEAREAFPARVPGLHARAAAWFETAGDRREALVHRLAAGDRDGAVRLMRVLGPQLLRDGQVETLRGFLDRIGDDAARSSTVCALLLAWCEFIAGRYGLAEAWVETALAAAPEGFDRTLAVSVTINVSLARGDVAPALDVARRIAAAGGLASHAADLATAVGAAFTWAGRADDARGALQVAVDKAAAERSRSAHVVALAYRAIVELEDGSTAAAGDAASTALDTARRFGLAAYHGVAPAHAVAARARAGDPAESRREALHALVLARRASTDLALAYVLTACADTLLDLGDPAGGRLLAEARSVVDRCADPGVAGRYLARAEARHRAGEGAGPGAGADRPSRPRGPAAGPVEPLTERELAVLRHLPGTRTQRAIAAELYVSLNTVKTHCRAIYRKLGVGDRRAAVQAARDLDIL
jgi:LuxR family maltose regulon positive regulatory protein